MEESMEIADYVISKASKDKHCISNLVLQTTLYFLNVIYMQENDGEKLITNENFQKWAYGPVLKDVYKEYVDNGGSSINEPAKHIGFSKQSGFYSDSFEEQNLDEKYRKFIDKKLPMFYNFFKNSFYMVNKSHKEPQWINKGFYEDYSDSETLNFYNDNDNCFWRNC